MQRYFATDPWRSCSLHGNSGKLFWFYFIGSFCLIWNWPFLTTCKYWFSIILSSLRFYKILPSVCIYQQRIKHDIFKASKVNQINLYRLKIFTSTKSYVEYVRKTWRVSLLHIKNNKLWFEGLMRVSLKSLSIHSIKTIKKRKHKF